MTMVVITVGLTQCYKKHIPKMMGDIYELQVEKERLKGRLLILENKINLAVKVADGVVFLKGTTSKFTFDYDK